MSEMAKATCTCSCVGRKAWKRGQERFRRRTEGVVRGRRIRCASGNEKDSVDPRGETGEKWRKTTCLDNNETKVRQDENGIKGAKDAGEIGKLVFPFTCVAMNDMPKLGLLLNAVDPTLGGIAIMGAHGTGKSVLARSIVPILPRIEVMTKSWCNANPDMPEEWESDLRSRVGTVDMEGTNRTMHTTWKPCPFVQVPLGVTEDMLLGTVDVEKSLEKGESVFQPGLLARAHRGVLYLDDMNLMDDGILNLLLCTLGNGLNNVEREGISVKHPCKPLLIATINTDEGEVRERLMDQIAIHTCTDTIQNLHQRVLVSETNARFADLPLETYLAEEERLCDVMLQVSLGRELLPLVHMSRKQILYLAEECSLADVEGQRCEIYACRVARAVAALSGRTFVDSRDLVIAVALVISPRAKLPLANQQNHPPPPQAESKEQEQDTEEHPDTENEEEEQPKLVPQQFVFDPTNVALDPKLLLYMKAMQKVKGQAGRTKAKLYNLVRGRYVKSAFLKGNKVSHLAVDATLRAAAPMQKRRRNTRKANQSLMSNFRRTRGDDPEKVIWIDKSDLRNKLMVKKSGNLVIFIVDASGSMALNRMDAAKGAAIGLLSQSYRNRDMVSVICFNNSQAQLILPPSRSVQMANKRLEKLPCGGGSPLSHGIAMAVRTALNARKSKEVGRVIFIIITDGRANVPLAASLDCSPADAGMVRVVGEPEVGGVHVSTKEQIKEEVLSLVSKLPCLGIDVLVVDTESKYISSGFARSIANAGRGTYLYLPHVSSQVLSSCVADAQ